MSDNCPACGSRQVGRVGGERYYCWECCIEFTLSKKGIRLFSLDEEGTPLELKTVGVVEMVEGG